MSNHDGISRRDVLGMAVAAGGLAMFGGGRTASAQASRRTPDQILGPFYPVARPLHQGTDLTVIPGKPGRAAGQVIHVMGRVVNLQGQPVQGARVEIWQGNTHGRYTHPSDHNPAPLDPNFEGSTVLITDAQGRYRIVDAATGRERAEDALSARVMDEAISYYQLASRAYKSGQLKLAPQP